MRHFRTPTQSGKHFRLLLNLGTHGHTCCIAKIVEDIVTIKFVDEDAQEVTLGNSFQHNDQELNKLVRNLKRKIAQILIAFCWDYHSRGFQNSFGLLNRMRTTPVFHNVSEESVK